MSSSSSSSTPTDALKNLLNLTSPPPASSSTQSAASANIQGQQQQQQQQQHNSTHQLAADPLKNLLSMLSNPPRSPQNSQQLFGKQHHQQQQQQQDQQQERQQVSPTSSSGNTERVSGESPHQVSMSGPANLQGNSQASIDLIAMLKNTPSKNTFPNSTTAVAAALEPSLSKSEIESIKKASDAVQQEKTHQAAGELQKPAASTPPGRGKGESGSGNGGPRSAAASTHEEVWEDVQTPSWKISASPLSASPSEVIIATKKFMDGSLELSNRIHATTYTYYNFDQVFQYGRAVASNSSFIAYSAKSISKQSGNIQGVVRVLQLNTENKCLVRGHGSLIADLSFAPMKEDLLATIDKDGVLLLSRVSKEVSGELKASTLLEIKVAQNKAPALSHFRVQWLPPHPTNFNRLSIAATFGESVKIFEIINEPDSTVSTNYTVASTVLCEEHTKTVNDIAFSPTGDIMFTASSDGKVKYWNTKTGKCIFDLLVSTDAPVESVIPFGDSNGRFLDFAGGSPCLPFLITGSNFNSQISIWSLEKMEFVQRICFVEDSDATSPGTAPGAAIFHIASDTEFSITREGFLLVSDLKRHVLNVLMFSKASSCFTHFSQFATMQSLVSFLVAKSGKDASGSVFNINMHAVQTKCVQALQLKFEPVEQNVDWNSGEIKILPLNLSKPTPPKQTPQSQQHMPAQIQKQTEAQTQTLSQTQAPAPIQSPIDSSAASKQEGRNGTSSSTSSTSSSLLTSTSSSPQSVSTTPSSTHQPSNTVAEASAKLTRQPKNADSSKPFSYQGVGPVSEALIVQIRKELSENNELLLRQVQNIVKENEKAEKQRQSAFLNEIAAALAPKVAKELQASIMPAIQQNIVFAVKETLANNNNRENALASSSSSTNNNTTASAPKVTVDSSAAASTNAALSNKALAESVAKHIASCLRAPIVDTFVSTFQSNVIPAFEGAVGNMLSQINTTFDRGTQDYLQQVRQLEIESKGGISSGLSNQLLQSFAQSLQTSLSQQQQATTAAISSNFDSAFARLQQDMRDVVVVAANNKKSFDRKDKESKKEGGGVPSMHDRERIWNEISTHLSCKEYGQAFGKALRATDLALLVKLLQSVSANHVFTCDPLQLDQPTILALVQQTAFDLSKDLDVKVPYLQQAVAHLDPTSPVISAFTAKILNVVNGKLKELLASSYSPSSQTANLKMIQIYVDALLAQCKTE